MSKLVKKDKNILIFYLYSVFSDVIMLGLVKIGK